MDCSQKLWWFVRGLGLRLGEKISYWRAVAVLFSTCLSERGLAPAERVKDVLVNRVFELI